MDKNVSFKSAHWWLFFFFPFWNTINQVRGWKYSHEAEAREGQLRWINKLTSFFLNKSPKAACCRCVCSGCLKYRAAFSSGATLTGVPNTFCNKPLIMAWCLLGFSRSAWEYCTENQRGYLYVLGLVGEPVLELNLISVARSHAFMALFLLLYVTVLGLNSTFGEPNSWAS